MNAAPFAVFTVGTARISDRFCSQVVAGVGEREDFRIVGGAPGCFFRCINSGISEHKVSLSVLRV
jgi:hypothetical protein